MVGKKFHVLALPIAVAALAAVASPAQAATGYDRCQEGNYCLFSGLDGTGDIVQLQASTASLAALGMGDRAKSDWNRTDTLIHLYSEADYGGCSAVTGPRGKGNFYSTFRDFFDSVRFGGPNGPACSIGGDELTIKRAATVDSHG
ncbi:peptidase inhibitor family I36 protein [Nonomuraea sp. NPDC052265]|uniref:peptidase inhibitor family I36 protein n=1 Tax=Nonomuraea sp. NPDC052265 TaxID=3364374 RepID=UPI0037CB6651